MTTEEIRDTVFPLKIRLKIQHDLRLRFGLQKNFAEKLGVAQSTLSAVIHGIDRSYYVETALTSAIGWNPWDGIPARRRQGKASGSQV